MPRKPRPSHLSPVRPEPSLEQAERHLALLWASSPRGYAVHSLRILGGTRANGRLWYPTQGYWDDPTAAAQAAVTASQEGADAVYVTLNPLLPACLDRSPGAWGGKGTAAASDDDVARVYHLLLDLDPRRPKGVSATEAELGAARARADTITAWLLDVADWPAPLYRLDSGNGVHLVWRLRLDPERPDHKALVRACLESAALQWSDAEVDVDLRVGNPGRITKVAGTWARKGASTTERPHRVAWLAGCEPRSPALPLAALREFAARWEDTRTVKDRATGETRTTPAGLRLPERFAGAEGLARLEAEAEARGLAPKRKEDWKPGTTLLDLRCWRGDHGHRTGYAILRDGLLLARCHAAGCDADTSSLLAALGIDPATEVPRTDPDLAAASVAAANATGLTELWEGDSLLYTVAHPETGTRRLRTAQQARTWLDRLPSVPADDGQPIHPFQVWTRSLAKRLAYGTTWDPEAPFGAILGEGLRARLNLWQGFAFDPASAAARSADGTQLAKAWREHLEANVAGGASSETAAERRGARELATYLLRLFAWKVQHPTHRPLVFVVALGEPGGGKGQLLLPLVNCFGAHGLHSQSEASRFNAKLEGKAFVFHDESEYLASARTMRLLKAAVTEGQVSYEEKYVSAYQGQNIALHVAASNAARIALDPGDRRVLLLDVRAPEGGADWFRERGLDRLTAPEDLERDEGGLPTAYHAALLRMLLAVRIPADWRPFPPPRTAARDVQIHEALDPLGQWLAAALARGEVPGLRHLGGEVVPWPEKGGPLEWGAQHAMHAAFVRHLRERGGRTAWAEVPGVTYPGFAARTVRLLGVQVRVERRPGGKGKAKGQPERRWHLPALEAARARLARELGTDALD